MTKYILHGGETKVKNKFNDFFFKEIVSSKEGPLEILLIFFAREEKEWKKLEERAINQFTRADPQRQIIFKVASKNPEKFAQQVKDSDIIYLLGGETPMLLKELSHFNNLEDLFNGKIVVGSSAGAYVLSRYYYSRKLDAFNKGFGILPIKVMGHYSGKLKNKLKKFKSHGEDLPIYTIEETKHIVIEK